MDKVRNRSDIQHTICMSSLRGMTAASIEDKITKIEKENNVTIEFLWIKGHSALNNNEKDDLLAKEAAVTGEVMDIRLPWSDLKGKAKRDVINRW
ncbi:hypothetical protein O3M35_000458 [Rhynocoris fuscipes]|uniref:RNase H type-1 domain-containing protein n=1 Tax=Rhynocoris fuscipes TaxID=488301 RepID=A0AAW1DLS1_9HEMI